MNESRLRTWLRERRRRRKPERTARATLRGLRRAARRQAGQLERIGGTDPLFLRSGTGPVVVSIARDEALRLPWFLEHHRRLGFPQWGLFLMAEQDV
jgi:hypothetical protein